MTKKDFIKTWNSIGEGWMHRLVFINYIIKDLPRAKYFSSIEQGKYVFNQLQDSEKTKIKEWKKGTDIITVNGKDERYFPDNYFKDAK